VKAATGEDVSEEEMGGSTVHTTISGVADLEVADDAECLDSVRSYLSFFPSDNRQPPPVLETSDHVDRRCDAILDILATAPRRAYTIEPWPTAEIAVMCPYGMVNIIMRKQLEAIPEGGERTRARLEMA